MPQALTLLPIRVDAFLAGMPRLLPAADPFLLRPMLLAPRRLLLLLVVVVLLALAVGAPRHTGTLLQRLMLVVHLLDGTTPSCRERAQVSSALLPGMAYQYIPAFKTCDYA